MCDEKKLKLAEYERCMDAWKHMGTLQLALMPVYVALMGAAFLIVFREPPPPDQTLRIIYIGLIGVTVIFYVIQESHMFNLGLFYKRLAYLEDDLGFNIINNLPKIKEYKIAPAKWAIRLLYFSFLALWAFMLYKIICISI